MGELNLIELFLFFGWIPALLIPLFFDGLFTIIDAILNLIDY